LRGGIESYTFNIAQALTKQGHNAHIITWEGDGQYHLERYKGVYIHKLTYPIEPFRGSWRIDKFFPFLDLRHSYIVSKFLSKVIKEYSIDIVESPDWLYEGLYFAYSKRRNIPLVVRLHGHISVFRYYLQKKSIGLNTLLRLKLERKLAQKADILTTNSEFYANFISKVWNIDRSFIRIIPTGIDVNLFTPKYFKNNNEIKILYVGRLEENKGVGVISEVISRICSEFPNVVFLFIGQNKKCEGSNFTWRDYIRYKTGECNVIFFDPISTKELIKFYQQSQICIFPSIFEAFGMVVLEAMACGKPVIVTRVGAFPEIVVNDVNGILISPENSEELLRAIKRLLCDEMLREKLGENARKTIEEKFSLNKMIQQTLSLYRETIDRFRKS